MREYMQLHISSDSRNESFARVVVAAYAARLNPTVEEIADIKTAVSEAVTNAIIHGYEQQPGQIIVEACIEADTLRVEVIDYGCGIDDVARAMEPLYTSKPGGERSGLGFTVMQSFMDELEVLSTPGSGTRIKMAKRVAARQTAEREDEQEQLR